MNDIVYQEDCLEISLVNDLRELARVASEIDDFCLQKGINIQDAYSVNLAVDEVLTHIVSNGYEDNEPHRIEIVIRKEGQTLLFAIVDDSKASDASEVPADFDVGGESELNPALDNLGLFLVHQMMDDVSFRKMHGCNVLVMSKATSPEEAEE